MNLEKKWTLPIRI